ncbi:MAG: glycosyltransferase [Verrucomicrobiales bacterium]
MSGSMLQPDKEKPLISVIIPELFDDSRADIAFLRDWVEQTCEEPFEIIVVASPGRADFVSAVEQILRPSDKLIIEELSHEIEGYAIGASASRGQWIFVTENHVKPEPDCLREVLAFLADGSTDACVVKSVSISESKIARAEDACFQWQMQQQDPEQIALQLRGFVVRLDVFLRYGGLPAKYKTYAPGILSHRLANAGIKVRLLQKPLIHHVNCPTFQLFAFDIRDTTLGECIFADDPHLQAEVPMALPWRHSCDWYTVKALGQTALFPGRRLTKRRRLRTAFFLLREVARLALESSFVIRLRRMMAHLVCRWLRVRFVFTRAGSDEELAWFIRMWQQIVHTSQLDYAKGFARRQRADHRHSAVRIAAMSNDQMEGFHGLESHAGRTFRWSQPLAEIAVAIPASSHRFTIDTGGLRGDTVAVSFGLFVNRQRIPPNEMTTEKGFIVFTVPATWIVEGSATRVTILAEPLQEPRQFGGQRGRRLGLPFFDFHTEMI